MNNTPAALRADVAFNGTVSWQVSMVFLDALASKKSWDGQIWRRQGKPAVTTRAYR